MGDNFHLPTASKNTLFIVNKLSLNRETPLNLGEFFYFQKGYCESQI